MLTESHPLIDRSDFCRPDKPKVFRHAQAKKNFFKTTPRTTSPTFDLTASCFIALFDGLCPDPATNRRSRKAHPHMAYHYTDTVSMYVHGL
jgi:hypothetical protein